MLLVFLLHLIYFLFPFYLVSTFLAARFSGTLCGELCLTAPFEYSTCILEFSTQWSRLFSVEYFVDNLAFLCLWLTSLDQYIFSLHFHHGKRLIFFSDYVFCQKTGCLHSTSRGILKRWPETSRSAAGCYSDLFLASRLLGRSLGC